MRKVIYKVIFWYMQKELKHIRKHQDTPYIFINGTGKDFPKYLMYTDNKQIRSKMHEIY